MVNIRGNKPLLLNKMIYTEHELSKKLRDNSVSEYKPEWNKNDLIKTKENNTKKADKKKEIKSNTKVIEKNNKEEWEEITFDDF